jgi:uncharacterized DUF497 family protein
MKFEWDRHNRPKCEARAPIAEVEWLLSGSPYIDGDPSQVEPRFRAIGRSSDGRGLFVVFTLRDDRVRVISARFMHKEEIDVYEKAIPHFRKRGGIRRVVAIDRLDRI